jgi:subtilisin family serine protease
LLLLAAFSLVSSAPSASAGASSGTPFRAVAIAVNGSAGKTAVPNEVIVEYARGATPQRNQVASAQGAILKQSHQAGSSKSISYAVYDSSTLSASQLADKFKNLPGVLEVSPNNIDTCVGDSSVVPNDPDFAQQWGLDDIGAEQAWGVTTGAVAAGSKEPVIAVIDTGVDYTHPDLEANIWSDPASGVHGLNAYSGNDDPQDENGHGTHVAGITAAVGNNGVGVAGVSWSAKIMPLRFMDASGSGTDSAAIQCIDYAIDEKVSHGVDVVAINASWGASGGYDAVMADAIQAAGNAGIIFVAAAGNNGTDNGLEPFYPACYPCSNIISVGASDSSDVPASFSNYGATSVDLFAPGVNVISTFPPGMDLPDSNVPSNGYATLSGTSMATTFRIRRDCSSRHCSRRPIR